VNDDTLLELLHDTAAAIGTALGDLTDWGLAGTRSGQHHSDLAADRAALTVLDRAGVGVLSEESGRHRLGAGEPNDDIVIVLDPLDGSTNAAQGIPWFATSICAVDGDGLRAALVVDLAGHHTFTAIRGEGAQRDGVSIHAAATTAVGDSLLGLSGYPPRHLGWKQYRVLGAAALDLCAVASGTLDGYVDCSVDAHGAWDYAASVLICREAGAAVEDAAGRPLIALDHAVRRTPVAGATAPLLAHLLEARRTWPISESSRTPNT
jgi:fructose-1,6-bisphosphatase/inositol monophosphatase family enzyme